MLEKMGEFFEARLKGYEEHQLTCIESAREFYPFTAGCLPKAPGTRILDLGCGTGLELGFYFKTSPEANVTGIDLSAGMLGELQKKFPDKAMTLIQGSYFDVPFGENAFDAAVSAESLHHFTKEEKLPLYEKLHRALKDGGYFILTDYFALSEEEERSRRAELLRLKKEQGLADEEFYHYDTPLTVGHETEALTEAGFACVEVLKNWGTTYTLKAMKRIRLTDGGRT
jgi:tRNA (cmo5U34)-methyltransferase